MFSIYNSQGKTAQSSRLSKFSETKHLKTHQNQKSLVWSQWRDFCFRVGFMILGFFFKVWIMMQNLMRIKTVKEPTKSFGYTATEGGSPEKEISSGCSADRRKLSVIKEILPLALRNPSKTLIHLCWHLLQLVHSSLTWLESWWQKRRWAGSWEQPWHFMCLIWLFAVAKAENEKAQTFGQRFSPAAKAERASDTLQPS